MGGMLRGVTPIEADSGRKGIGDEEEQMTDFAFAVVIRDCLHRWCAGSDHEIEVAGGDLPCNGGAGRHVPLGVEALDREVVAVVESSLRQRIEKAFDSFVEDGRAGVLNQRDPRHASRRLAPSFEIGDQQHGRRERDQQDPEGEPPQGVEQVGTLHQALIEGSWLRAGVAYHRSGFDLDQRLGFHQTLDHHHRHRREMPADDLAIEHADRLSL